MASEKGGEFESIRYARLLNNNGISKTLHRECGGYYAALLRSYFFLKEINMENIKLSELPSTNNSLGTSLFNNYVLAVNNNGEAVKVSLKEIRKSLISPQLNIYYKSINGTMYLVSNLPLDTSKPIFFERLLNAKSSRKKYNAITGKFEHVPPSRVKGWRRYDSSTVHDRNVGIDHIEIKSFGVSNTSSDTVKEYIYKIYITLTDGLVIEKIYDFASIMFIDGFKFNPDSQFYEPIKIKNGSRPKILDISNLAKTTYATENKKLIWGFDYDGIKIPFFCYFTLYKYSQNNFAQLSITSKPYK